VDRGNHSPEKAVSLFGGKRRDGESEAAAPRAGERPSEGAEHRTPAVPPSGRTATTPGRREATGEGKDAMANIGKSISIKGDLTGEEDLVVEGKVEGKIDLPQNELTIGANGNAQAEVHAKTVLVVGRVTGNISASERVEIQSTGVVEGDVRAPRLVVQEGARLNGAIHMSEKAGERAGASAQPSRTAPPKVAAAGAGGGGEARPGGA